MLRLGCLLILVLIIGLPILASRFLPWWGVPLTIVAEAVGLIFLTPKLLTWGLKRFAIGLFMSKSRVLRGAQVQVHAQRPTTKPKRETEESAEAEPATITAADGTEIIDAAPTQAVDEKPDDKKYVLIDFTLTPKGGTSRMRLYEPSELMLVPFDAVVDLKEDPTSDEKAAFVEEMKIVDESGAEEEGYDKYTGPARFRAVFACPPTLRGRVKFRYYFETFGELTLG